ncbi:MAG: hypothetical protein PHG44_03585 [Lentisphaeria bacterium]|nr:hypothetical protein [Lentisphaeria bacterium]
MVEFLTDNTLGRIWYEMTKGETGLNDSCRYLVRRPNEIFLDEGQEIPEPDESTENMSQEELLRHTVHILHRPLKDPRDIRMLDPACGSMHFGLYAFDLFERIYDEAWEIEAARGSGAFTRSEGLKPLTETYACKEAFLRDVPRLIIERNIHGIDIDPRAVQIAGLSLWLRAQKSWQAQGVKSPDRPQVQRSNIVCAEPMPGEVDMLDEFAAQLQPKVLGQLVRIIFEKMKLAGEAGSLLRIEEDIKDAIADAHSEYQKFILQQKKEKGFLPGMAPERQATLFDFADLPKEDDFWYTAEQRVIDALRDYAEGASSTETCRRRMFAEDAARGFVFIDLSRKTFDVALMNPPFGESSKHSKKYIDEQYKTAKTDLGMAFVTRWLSRLRNMGFLGAITNRVFLANQKLGKWRDETLIGEQARLMCMADLGIGVLDALVEATAYTLAPIKGKSLCDAVFCRVLDSRTKDITLQALTRWLETESGSRHVLGLQQFQHVPSSIMCYWLPKAALRLLSEGLRLCDVNMDAKQGMASGDDFRFFRLWWEVAAESIATSGPAQKDAWVPLVKGGEYSPLVDSPHLLVDWRKNGAGTKAYVVGRYPYLNGDWGWVVKNSDSYFREGLSYPARTASDFSPRIMPRGCIFSAKGQAILGGTTEDLVLYLFGAYSRFYKAIVEAFLGSGDSSVSGSAAKDIRSGLLNDLPHPLPQSHASERLLQMISDVLWRLRDLERYDETSRYFSGPWTSAKIRRIDTESSSQTSQRLNSVELLCSVNKEIETTQALAFGMSQSDWQQVCELAGQHPVDYPEGNLPLEDVLRLLGLTDSDLVAECVSRCGASRQITKKAYIADRRLELIAHATRRSIRTIANSDDVAQAVAEEERPRIAVASVSYGVGLAFCRWKIRTTGACDHDRSIEDLFEPLPVSAPCQIPKDEWPSTARVILGCDADRGDDLVRLVRSALLLDEDDGPALEEEICSLLRVGSLTEYLTSNNGFFADHLSKYSQSRRQAPIYWPLSTPSGAYTLWLYYHRLTDQTLYTCVNDFVEPKLKQVAEEAARLRTKSARSSSEEKDLERLSNLELELRDFRDELLRIARFWKPNLNDGVQITAAPLWRLFQHRQWQARLRETWEKLEAGDYDWAHLALSIWPDRVVRASHKDRSYAIAHDLEDRLWHEVEVEKVGRGGRVTTTTEWQPRDLTEADLKTIIAEVQAR